MNDIAIGRSLRALRIRQCLPQADAARRAGVSQQLISKVECGRLACLSTATLRRIFAAVDADVVTIVRWRGGELDRLLDEGHAALVSRIVALLRRRGWQVLAEVTFSEFGERGSIDILAWHAATRTLLVIEVKTEIASAEEMLRRHDVKVRLAPGIGRARFGERPARVARLLVVADDREPASGRPARPHPRRRVSGPRASGARLAGVADRRAGRPAFRGGRHATGTVTHPPPTGEARRFGGGALASATPGRGAGRALTRRWAQSPITHRRRT